ncbi:MAG: nuclear transport factor 2 family protein [Sphingomonas sp.]
MAGRLSERWNFVRRMVALLAALALGAGAAAAAPLDDLARAVDRTESVRAIKTLQRAYAQYAQLGLWDATAALFDRDGIFVFDAESVTGRKAIARLLADRYGGGLAGSARGRHRTMLIETPVVTLSPDGESGKGRWHILVFLSAGGKASIEGGIFENDYVRRGGAWRIAKLHYYPQFTGPYETGWTNWGGGDLGLVPYHFTPDEAGTPIPAPTGPAPAARATFAEIEARIGALNDEDQIRNLQSAYGYYADRRMWDDVVDLFADNGVYEVGGAGRFADKAGVRHAVERMGPAGLTHGILNDRPQFDTIVQVMPGGTEAYARGIELGMLGDADAGRSSWEVSIFRNRFVKEGGIWKIREMRVFPLFWADYGTGWGDSPLAERVPALLGVHPVTGKRVAIRDALALEPLTGPIAPAAAEAGRIEDAARRLARSAAYDGIENVSTAYSEYLDDFQSPQMGALMAEKGFKVSAFAGYYIGREKIVRAAQIVWGMPTTIRPGISYHWRTQPVIDIAEDGRSANIRTRLFQPRTSKEISKAGAFFAAGFHAGMYHDQMVLEGGIWRFWNLSLDEPYFQSVDWKGGWAAAKDPPADYKAWRSPLFGKMDPDVPYADLGRRLEHFRGGTGKGIEWPGILPMWFSYRNPVSGRVPGNYMPDCVPCDVRPDLSMTRHGYLMPPTGPEPRP